MARRPRRDRGDKKDGGGPPFTRPAGDVMIVTLTRGACLFGLALALAGCAPTQTKPNAAPDGAADKPAKAGDEDGCCGCCEADEKPGDVTLKAATLDEVSEAIAANKGKVVVAELWASSCAPCVKSFPHLTELHRAYGPDGLACVSVSVDRGEDADKALAFLKQ